MPRDTLFRCVDTDGGRLGEEARDESAGARCAACGGAYCTRAEGAGRACRWAVVGGTAEGLQLTRATRMRGNPLCRRDQEVHVALCSMDSVPPFCKTALPFHAPFHAKLAGKNCWSVALGPGSRVCARGGEAWSRRQTSRKRCLRQESRGLGSRGPEEPPLMALAACLSAGTTLLGSGSMAMAKAQTFLHRARQFLGLGAR